MKDFPEWMAMVDAILWRTLACTSADLPDVCYRDWYDAGLSPMAAAKRVRRAVNA